MTVAVRAPKGANAESLGWRISPARGSVRRGSTVVGAVHWMGIYRKLL